MRIKKAFTLIEILFVLLIIGILFTIIGHLSWSYIYELNIQTDENTLLDTFLNVQITSLSQPIYKDYVLSYIGIKLFKNKHYFYIVGLTGNLNDGKILTLGVKHLSYLNFTGCMVDGDSFSTGIFLYKPYKNGAYFLTDSSLFSGKSIVKLYFNHRQIERCFQMNLNSGRLFKTTCED